MKAEKKFLRPVLYPLRRELLKPDGTPAEWFIKYHEEDFVKGGFAARKYKGMLNRISDLTERLKLAELYIEKMKRGEPLPDCQGARTSSPKSIEHPKTNTNVIECCKRFLVRKKIEGRANTTIIGYRSIVKMFSDWLRVTGRTDLAIGAITKDIAFEYLGYLQDRGNKNRNYHKTKLGAIWDQYEEVIRSNPWRKIKIDADPEKSYESYPPELQQRIKATLPAFNPQLWFVLQGIYYCALRPDEQRFLKVKHFDLAAGVVTVPDEIAKGKKRERKVVIYHRFLDQLRARFANVDPEFYIIGIEGKPAAKPVGKNWFNRKFKAYRRAHSIAEIYKLYGSKHTAGKKLAKQSNIYIAKEHFGHTDIAVTQAYTDDIDISELMFLAKEYPEFAGA